MQAYLLRRLLQMLPTLVIASFGIYALLLTLPGDPASMMLRDRATPDQIALLKHHMGIDQPIPVQYLIWLGHVLQGDLGTSYMNHSEVSWLLLTKLPVTLQLALGALLVSLLVSVPAGLIGATTANRTLRSAISTFYALSLSIPIFWLGLLFGLLFGVKLGWLPPSGYVPLSEDPLQWLLHLLLPSVTLGIAMSAYEGKFLQASLEETLGRDYIRTAHAKGIRPKHVLLRHAARNSLIPFVTSMAVQVGSLMGGAVLTEAIFGLPGIGQLLWQSTINRDYAVIQAAVLFVIVAFLLINLAADVAYAILDPRIRLR